MNNQKIINRLNNLEAAAVLLISECQKTKKELQGERERENKTGFTQEDAALLRMAHRTKTLKKYSRQF